MIHAKTQKAVFTHVKIEGMFVCLGWHSKVKPGGGLGGSSSSCSGGRNIRFRLSPRAGFPLRFLSLVQLCSILSVTSCVLACVCPNLFVLSSIGPYERSHLSFPFNGPDSKHSHSEILRFQGIRPRVMA